MQIFLLDLFVAIATMCAMGVIGSTNPIHSVIFLVLVFANTTGLLLTLTPKLEFIAIMFLIIYVGAIAVLFLFVVMMLSIRVERPDRLSRLAIASLAIIVASFLVMSHHSIPFSSIYLTFSLSDVYVLPITSGIQALGNLVYTYYFYFLLLAATILFVAMIGAIVLTIHKRKNASKKQFIFEQVIRRFEDAIHWAS